MSEVAYFAVADPGDPAQITYWRRDKVGRVSPWPARARYGPVLLKRDVPKGLGEARREWVAGWFREHRAPWERAIHEAIAEEPDACQARFAVFATRCCCCGRMLTDPKSKTVGVGPECRGGVSEDVLGRLTVMVGQIHAEVLESKGEAAA